MSPVPAPTLPSTPLSTLLTHSPSPINSLTFSSRGGTYLLTGGSDRQIHLCRTIPASSGGGGASSFSSTRSKNKKSITQTATQDDTAPTVTTTEPIQKYSGHGYAVLDIACSADNTTFASCGGDRVVFLWDVSRGETTRRFGGGAASADAGHTSRINCVRFAGQEGSVLLSGSDDKSVRVWDLRSRDARPVEVWDQAGDGIADLHVGEQAGWEVWSASTDGRVRRYDVRMGKVTVDVFSAPTTCVRATRDGRAMLVGSLDSRIRLMDCADGTCLRAFGAGGGGGGSGTAPGKDGYVNTELRLRCSFGKNEALVLAGSETDGAVRAWDVLSGEVVGKVSVGNEGGPSKRVPVVSCVQWREGEGEGEVDGGIWAAGSADGRVVVFGEGKREA